MLQVQKMHIVHSYETSHNTDRGMEFLSQGFLLHQIISLIVYTVHVGYQNKHQNFDSSLRHCHLHVHLPSAHQGSVTGQYIFQWFWSQGDGAMFEYSGIKQQLVDEFIDSLNLSPMRKCWLENNIYVSGKGNHRGHYYHDNCCNHAIYWEVDNGDLHWSSNFHQWLESFSEEFESFVIDKYKDMCRDLHRDLEREYDYLTSEDAIIETMNEYEFFENGDML